MNGLGTYFRQLMVSPAITLTYADMHACWHTHMLSMHRIGKTSAQKQYKTTEAHEQRHASISHTSQIIFEPLTVPVSNSPKILEYKGTLKNRIMNMDMK